MYYKCINKTFLKEQGRTNTPVLIETVYSKQFCFIYLPSDIIDR